MEEGGGKRLGSCFSIARSCHLLGKNPVFVCFYSTDLESVKPINTFAYNENIVVRLTRCSHGRHQIIASSPYQSFPLHIYKASDIRVSSFQPSSSSFRNLMV